MAALAAGMKARDGRATVRDGLSLSIVFLGDPLRHDDAAAEAVRFYLDGLGCGQQQRAGEALVEWVQATFPFEGDAEPDAKERPVFDWQRRADCGL
ncbi:hypothetical protein [Maritimibacter alexandrii]|uniref:hypothetical protein n=1 Tax=Maritimibacter alexandrii TaxID=2570355 RepID=UPI001108553A|nr:hypothetical protein [Maritimibacter alexandrii]